MEVTTVRRALPLLLLVAACTKPEAAASKAAASKAAASKAAASKADESKPAEPVRIAAASDLTEVFTELARQYEAETGHQVTLTFGASGLLATQLVNGAPFDVFAAANARFVDTAVAAQACDGTTARPYARGRLVLVGHAPIRSLDELVDAERIAIANPEIAPYGAAAKEALLDAGLWNRVEPKLVFAQNVRQALTYVERGDTQFALVSMANVVGRDAGEVMEIDEARYQPLVQTVVACRHGRNREGANRFIDFLFRPTSQAVLRARGFRE